jgi:alkylated DNA repair dioxygenase AlkB
MNFKEGLFFLDVPGLSLTKEFITLDEEQELINRLDKESWNTSLSRRTQHYGYEYSYTDKDAKKTAPPIPEYCDYLIDRLLEQNILKERPDQMIVNEYKPGQGIAPHVDNVKYFTDGIASVSLGSDVMMDFINVSTPSLKKEGVLNKRSVLSMHGIARYKWKHGIAQRTKDPVCGKRTRRISLTFRKMK